MIFIDACFKKKTPYRPVWFMRQAGRYLKEYNQVRQKAGDFLSLCKNPELASTVTLQPIDILDVDAAILFSDILVVPLEMGMKLEFLKGEGPRFDEPIRDDSALLKLNINAAKKLNYVYETIAITRTKLDSKRALIGFCGSPWTLATYMIEGESTKTFSISKKLVYSNPLFVHTLLGMLLEVLKEYLKAQIEAGVNAVMVFDSWANALEMEAFFEFSWEYMLKLSSFIKKEYPHIPVILFPKGIGSYLDKIDGEFDVFGVDWSTPIELAVSKLSNKYVLQGNLEPARLYNKEAMIAGAKKILEATKNLDGFIFNLGHGMLPDLPRENAIELVRFIKSQSI